MKTILIRNRRPAYGIRYATPEVRIAVPRGWHIVPRGLTRQGDLQFCSGGAFWCMVVPGLRVNGATIRRLKHDK